MIAGGLYTVGVATSVCGENPEGSNPPPWYTGRFLMVVKSSQRRGEVMRDVCAGQKERVGPVSTSTVEASCPTMYGKSAVVGSAEQGANVAGFQVKCTVWVWLVMPPTFQ